MRTTQLDAEDGTDRGRLSPRLAGSAGFRLPGVERDALASLRSPEIRARLQDVDGAA